MRSKRTLSSPPSPPKGCLASQSEVLTDWNLRPTPRSGHEAPRPRDGGLGPRECCHRVRALSLVPAEQVPRAAEPLLRLACDPARQTMLRRPKAYAACGLRDPSWCSLPRRGSQPIKSPGFLQPYGPRGEQQCPGPFTSKAAIRGKAPPEIFFFSSQLFIPIFFFFKGIGNSRARASLMPFDGD